MQPVRSRRSRNRYQALVEKVFLDKYVEGLNIIPFKRTDLSRAARVLEITLPKNLGDIIYSTRYRAGMPESIIATEPEGLEWIIEGAGRSCYTFKLVNINRIVPNTNLVDIKIPDSTPEVVSAYALSDEQALLAKVRYNRLVDIFLGIAAYSLQNHLRTTVQGIGQVEIDEIYVGIDNDGRQFIFPVQAKGGTDQLSVIQTKQDIACCAEKFPRLICRSISAQFMHEDLIAMFELSQMDDEIRIAQEKHYRLVPADQISDDDLRRYRQ